MDSSLCICYIYLFFLFNTTRTVEIYTYCHTLSLHDALPICAVVMALPQVSNAQEVIAEEPDGGDNVIVVTAQRQAQSLQDVPIAVSDRYILQRSEEHTSELQSLMCHSYAVFCLKKKQLHQNTTTQQQLNNNIKTPDNT